MHPSVSFMLRNPMLRQAIARALAARGRGGDTMIAHLNPAEAMMLKRLGGAGTINPRTGLPEFTADPRGDIGGGTNHDNQPGNDSGMGGDVGNGRSGGGGYGHAGDSNGSGAGSGGGHSGEGGGINNPRQPTVIIQQPPPVPRPIAQPPAPIPVATAPLMSATATTDLTGGRFGKLPGWDLKPYRIGTVPTAYPTPGLTPPPTVTQPPPPTGGHPVLPPPTGGGSGGLGGLGGLGAIPAIPSAAMAAAAATPGIKPAARSPIPRPRRRLERPQLLQALPRASLLAWRTSWTPWGSMGFTLRTTASRCRPRLRRRSRDRSALEISPRLPGSARALPRRPWDRR